MLSNFNFQPVVHFFQIYPESAGIIAFFVVFIESLAVIGSVIPGVIIMPTLGFLIGSATIAAGNTIFWALCGALAADYLGYLIGVYYQSKLHRLWPFCKHPQLLKKSETFFKNHGGKSILLGKFMGPMRPMIPLVAGVFKMRQLRFIGAALPSALVWIIVYLSPGILLGALSLEMPPKLATKFTLYVLLFIVLIWILFWLVHLFFKRICIVTDTIVAKIWQGLRRHAASRWIATLLADPRAPHDHSQLTLLLFAILCITVFVIILVNVVTHGILTVFNVPLFYFLTSLRFPALDKVMVAVTLCGEAKVVLPMAFIVFIWLLAKRYWHVAINWIALLALGVASISELKKLVFSVRPYIAAATLQTSSFPSGHTVLAVTLFGFLAVIIARELPINKRKLPYFIAGGMVFCVGFSRLYLGAHWLTDVLAGIFLGLAIVLMVTVSYRRRHATAIVPIKFSVLVGSIFCAVWLAVGLTTFTKQMHDYALTFPVVTITPADLLEAQDNIPLYRLNRFGHPIQIFNVRWLGRLEDIKQDLIKQGWEEQTVKNDLPGMVRTFAVTSVNHHFPLLPQLYHNRPAVLLLTKDTDTDDTLLILTLWQADLIIKNNDLPVWVGAIEYHRASPKIFSLHRLKNKAPFVGATDYMPQYLQNFWWQQVVVSPAMQPQEILDLHWDGKLLVVQPHKLQPQRRKFHA